LGKLKKLKFFTVSINFLFGDQINKVSILNSVTNLLLLLLLLLDLSFHCGNYNILVLEHCVLRVYKVVVLFVILLVEPNASEFCDVYAMSLFYLNLI
jgi:hypothetical protein